MELRRNSDNLIPSPAALSLGVYLVHILTMYNRIPDIERLYFFKNTEGANDRAKVNLKSITQKYHKMG